MFIYTNCQLQLKGSLVKKNLAKLGDMKMSKEFNVQQARPSKIQIEVKDILQTSTSKSLASGLNFDADGGDRNFDADGGDRNFDADGGDRNFE